MESLPFKKRLRRRVLLGLVIVMLFGLFGCGNRQTPEQAAQAYLEKKYGGTFVVEELSRKENDSVVTREYSGFAYREGQPLDRFTVWVSGDRKTVYDSAHTARLLPEIRTWIGGEVSAVWADARSTVTLRAVSHDGRTDYTPAQFREYLKNESVEVTVHVILSRDALTAERFMELNEALQDTMKGYVKLYFLTGQEAEQTDPAQLLTREADLWIGIGSSREFVEKKIQSVRGE